MNFKPINSVFLIILTVLGMILTIGLAGYVPAFPSIVPDAHASPPNNPAILALFNEARKSSAVVDPTLVLNGLFNMDVNVTDAGQIKGFDINITFTSTTIQFFNSTFTGLKCPGCIFQSITTSLVSNATNTCVTSGCTATGNPRAYRLSVVDQDSATPFVNGNGVLFRVAFRVQAAGVASVIHIETSLSVIQNPGPLQYNAVDGYFDNRGGTASNFGISESPTTVTISRPILATTQTGTTVVSLSSPLNIAQPIPLQALGLPKNTQVSFTVCNPAPCTSTLTFTITGGPKTASTTTPSGTFSIPIIGNTTGTGVSGRVIRATWLKLIIQPPAPPVYSFSTSSPKVFTQQAGNWTSFNLSVTLTSGSNDSIVFGNNCNQKTNAAGDCKVNPPAGSFPLAAVMNYSSFPNGALGTFRFNITATTQGTYSEVIKTQNITFTMTLRRDHDLRGDNVAISKIFSYAGVSLAAANQLQANVSVTNLGTVSENFQINATGKTVLLPNTNLRWVDYPYVTQALKTDPKIKFIGLGTTWATGNTVVYDSNNNGVYDTGEPVISGFATNGQALKTDAKIKYVDLNGDNLWSSGVGFPSAGADFEPVIYDTNSNSVYDTGEPIILGGNNFYDTGEVVINDLDGNGVYGVGRIDSNLVFVATLATDSHIKFAGPGTSWVSGNSVVYDTNLNGLYDAGEPVIAGATPTAGTAVKVDPLIKYVDANVNAVWNAGEAVVYDANNNNVFDFSDTIIAGNPRLWHSGDAVVYDTDFSATYTAGDILVVGTAPALNTPLTFDAKLAFVDFSGSTVYVSGDSVFYDANGNGVFDVGETVIFGTAPAAEPVIAGTAPALGTPLAAFANLSFVDSNYNGLFGPLSPIIFDANNNGVYDNSDPVVRGPAPSGGILLGTQTVTVGAGLSQKFTILWDPGILPRGTYIIAGAAVPVTGEYNLGNNQVILGANAFTSKFKGDVSGDCKVDIVDLATVGSTFGKTRGQPGFNAAADLNNDGVINIVDLVLVAGSFGQSC